MAKAELFRIPLLGAIIRACGAYPVKRGASDREAIRMATARLAEGWAIGVFLDGTRQSNGRVNTPMHGAALLAARSNAPLLPVAIINTHRVLGTGKRWPRIVPIQLRIGEPIPAPSSRRKPDLEAATMELQRQINNLLDQGLVNSAKERLPPHSHR
jgi:1-acyl-sn-glycerol-3-phosphate acyltransferase